MGEDQGNNTTATMPPKKRKAEAEVVDDGNGGGSLTPATKKSKKEAALEARARAKAWRDNRRQQLQSGASSSSSSVAAAATKTKTTTSPTRPTTPEAIAFAEASFFSNGRKPPKMAAALTTSSKRRRTPAKRAASATTSSSRRKSARKATVSDAASTPSSPQQRSAIIPTNFQFDESAVVEKQPAEVAAAAVASTTREEVVENELLPTLGDKKKKQLEGRARIENLRKKRQESGLKVTSPVVAQEESVIERAGTVDNNDEKEDAITATTTTATKTITTTKTLVVTPGKIGLSLNVNLTKGGATVTHVAPTCRYIGQIAVGDIIRTINGKLVKCVSDMHTDTDKDRVFEVVSEKEVVEEMVVASGDPPKIAAMAVTNSKTAVDPPPSLEAVREVPPPLAGVVSHPIISTSISSNNGNDNRLNEAARFDASTTTTKLGRNGPTKLQQLRDSMRNVPAVKSASTGADNDDKSTARPSPPGKVVSVVASAATTSVSAPTPNAAQENNVSNDEDDNGGILKASISRAHQLVSSVAFVNRQRRSKLGIKSDSTGDDDSIPSSTAEGDVTQIASPSMDPPSSDIAGAEEKIEDKLVEESPIDESDVVDEPRVSFGKKIAGLICMVLKCVSILPLAIGAFYLLFSLQGDSSVVQLESTSAIDDAVPLACFANYPSGFHSSDENMAEDDGCGGTYIQCPQWGRCHGGTLIDCHDEDGDWQGLDRFVPNEGGRACIPSDSALMISEVVQNALINTTVAQSCRSSDMIADPASVLLQEPYPLFSLDVVSWKVNEASEVNITLSAGLLLWLQPVFDSGLVSFGHLSESDSVPNAIGLSSKVPEHKLPVPFSCKTKFIFAELFGLLARVFYRTVVLLLQIFWKYIVTYPKSSPVVLLFFGSVVIIRNKKKHRAKVREIFHVVKEEAYDRLAHCDGSGGYAALHLRDDVGHALYPSNMRERLFMYNHVWPQVIDDVRGDNRVRKFRKSAGGKQLEHWDLNTNSKRGWQMRKTPNKTPAKPVGTRSSTKRDP